MGSRTPRILPIVAALVVLVVGRERALGRSRRRGRRRRWERVGMLGGCWGMRNAKCEMRFENVWGKHGIIWDHRQISIVKFILHAVAKMRLECRLYEHSSSVC